MNQNKQFTKQEQEDIATKVSVNIMRQTKLTKWNRYHSVKNYEVQ